MSLTGQPFRWLTIAVAIVATIGAVVLWNRVRGPRPIRLAGRAVLLTAGYITAAVAVLVSVNIAYGGLIASWGDLIDNLMPANGGWHQHYRHHRYPQLQGPPAGWAGREWQPSVFSSPPRSSLSQLSSQPSLSSLPSFVSQERSPCAIVIPIRACVHS